MVTLLTQTHHLQLFKTFHFGSSFRKISQISSKLIEPTILHTLGSILPFAWFSSRLPQMWHLFLKSLCWYIIFPFVYKSFSSHFLSLNLSNSDSSFKFLLSSYYLLREDSLSSLFGLNSFSQKTNNPIQKLAKDLNRYPTKEDGK